ELYRRAASQSPDEAPAAAATWLVPEALPPALGEQDGHAHYVLASVLHALGMHNPAVEHVELALNLGVATDESYGDAPAWRLKGELLETEGAARDAGIGFYQAGKRFGWRGEHELAVEMLSRAAELAPDEPAIYWYWADSLQNLSSKSEAKNEEALNQTD